VTAGIDVLLCTFRRPQVVDTLRCIEAQVLPQDVRLRVIVADNDDRPTAREAVRGAAAEMRRPVVYLHAPARNISVARNACLDAATADWIAFIDDDETAPGDWLAKLLSTAAASGADAVFGPARAVYGPETPDWMREQDHHSNIPEPRRGIVETGHSCNALLRWRGAPWHGERFEVSLGRSGGEDTEFFFRLRRRGARFAIAEDAEVFEPVPAERQTLRWLCRRKYRIGQTYAYSAGSLPARASLCTRAAAKSGYCMAAAALHSGRTGRRWFWLLRGIMHAGVCVGCFSTPKARIYGE
jgi:succinoglycan biosynthesis protein ExoM